MSGEANKGGRRERKRTGYDNSAIDFHGDSNLSTG
jgi:hypothetical protein